MGRPVLPLVNVAVAVIERAGRYLVTRRPVGSHLAGCWEFPGGKRQADETWQQCLARELREELGVSATVGRRLRTIRFDYPDCRVQLVVFECAILEGRPRAKAADGLRWMSAAELARAPFPPANRVLVELLASRSVSTHVPPA
jgi:mutator protein MutT